MTLKKGNISVHIQVTRFQSWNDSYKDIVDAFDEISDWVNSEGGWNVYEWGKRGLINDVCLLVDDIK